MVSKVSYNSGATIFSPFVREENVYHVTSGYVIAYTYQDDGKRRIHLIYGPGSYFPVLTTFRGGEQRATYEALTAVVAEKYIRKAFLELIEANQAFCKEILNKTVAQLGIFANRLIGLQLTKLEEKLLHRLQSLAVEHGEKLKKGRRLPYVLRHYHLSDMLGSERESVTRALAHLEQKGQIAKDSTGRLIIS